MRPSRLLIVSMSSPRVRRPDRGDRTVGPGAAGLSDESVELPVFDLVGVVMTGILVFDVKDKPAKTRRALVKGQHGLTVNRVEGRTDR